MEDHNFPEDIRTSVKLIKENISDIDDLHKFIEDENDEKRYRELYTATISTWGTVLEYFWRNEDKQEQLTTSSTQEKDPELEKLWKSMILMTDLNQRSMQTPAEEEKKRNSQVEDIRRRVNELEERQRAKKITLDDISNELKVEKEKATKEIQKVTEEQQRIEDDNTVKLKELRTKFEKDLEEDRNAFNTEFNEKQDKKTKREKELATAKAKIFKGENATIKEWLENLQNQQSAIKKYDDDMSEKQREFDKLENKYKQLMQEKERLEIQKRRNEEEEAWKKRVDDEYNRRMRDEDRKKQEYEQAAEWLQAIFRAIEQIRNKKSKKGRKKGN